MVSKASKLRHALSPSSSNGTAALLLEQQRRSTTSRHNNGGTRRIILILTFLALGWVLLDRERYTIPLELDATFWSNEIDEPKSQDLPSGERPFGSTGTVAPFEPAVIKDVANSSAPQEPDLIIRRTNVTSTGEGSYLENTSPIPESSAAPRALALPSPSSETAAPSKHVVLRWRAGEIKDKSELGRIPVVVWPSSEFGNGNAASSHMEENGIHESPWLEVQTNMSDVTHPQLIWMGDTGYQFGFSKWCGEYGVRVQAAMAQRKALGLSPPQWPIFIVDWTDGDAMQKCYNIESLVGRDHVFYSKRSIVKNRMWKDELQWVDTGSRVDLTDGHRKYLHTPFIVRTDTVERLQDVLKENHNLTLHDSIERLVPRPVDVSHFWPVNLQGVGSIHSNLRTKVSRILQAMSNETSPQQHQRPISPYVGLAGDAVRSGRRSVKSVYVEALLRSKIVVVVQRDAWEDHYRLFEGLVSGAMVMTDRMVSLPAGLENGTSVIEFGSEAELRSLLLYYLSHDDERQEIAARGRRISMARHRSWHRMEEVIFGEILSNCPNSDDDEESPCPFLVHAKDGMKR